MPSQKLIRAYYEGDDDRVVLERLQAAGLLPTTLDVAKRDKKHAGKDGLVYELSTFVRPVNGVGGSAIALVDLDGQKVDEFVQWFQSSLHRHLPATEPAIQVNLQPTGRPSVSLISITSEERMGSVALVAVGLADDDELRSTFGIEEFAIDDHLFRLSRDPDVYAAVPDFAEVPYAVASTKLGEMAQLLRANNLPIRRSKRFLHLLRAIVGFRASSATFVDRLLTKAVEAVGQNRVRELLSPLVDDLEEAIKVVSE
jgi:hypothetical protein